MRTMASLIVAGVVLAGATAAAAQRERLPANCRQEIVVLCRGAEGGIRQCLRGALPRLSEECRTAISERSARGQPLPPGAVEHAYGADPKQRLDLVRPAGAAKAPVLVFVHGGGWSIGDKRHSAATKAAHFSGKGWAFASVNYRLVPNATVEQQAADVAAALGWLRVHAAAQGLDPDRIVLMGHSAGAHLAALVATDPRFVAAAGVPLASVRGVVLLDGAGYDVARQMGDRGNRVSGMYQAAFGSDPARQRALSPTVHAAAPNALDWLILPIERRDDSIGQSNQLAAALRAAGSKAEVVPVPGESHSSLNKGLGEAGDFATARIDSFLGAIRR